MKGSATFVEQRHTFHKRHGNSMKLESENARVVPVDCKAYLSDV